MRVELIIGAMLFGSNAHKLKWHINMDVPGIPGADSPEETSTEI